MTRQRLIRLAVIKYPAECSPIKLFIGNIWISLFEILKVKEK